MAKKFSYNPIIGSYGLLNKSYNRIKSQGNKVLINFRSYLEDDDIKVLLSVVDTKFESFDLEIFDLQFRVRMEIDLVAHFNTFTKGRFVTYFVMADGELQKTPMEFKYDEEGRLFALDNYTAFPDFKDMESFVLEYINMLLTHILEEKYISIPNATYEGEKDFGDVEINIHKNGRVVAGNA